jgi:SAM-dependent methyltransferase
VSAQEIASRGAEAVGALRSAQGRIGRWFYQDRPELLDLPGTPAAVKQRILGDVERITRLLRLDRYWSRRIGRLIVEARRTRRGKPVRVLDVGAGAGGLLARVEDWAWRRRIPVELIGIDYDPAGVDKSRRRVAEEGRHIDFRLGDARRLAELEDGSVDVAVTTFMLHHLPPGDVACVLAEMDRVAAVNFMAFDLRRTVVALPALWALLRLGGFEAPSRHDATASLRRGYTVPEVEALLAAGGVKGARVLPVPPAYLVATRA